MSRYIDADILSDALRHLTLGETDAARATMKITHYVSRMPTADVVDVVRCKDCKYDHKCSHNIIRPSKGGGVIYCPLEYCSEGERA